MTLEEKPLNVFDKPIEACSMRPLTGFYRDGCCRTGEDDLGMHTVCIVATKEFLEFSKKVGNDLSTSRPEYLFDGVKPGDRWCLCALRWLEAYEAGFAPMLILEATNKEMLKTVPFEVLLEYKFSVEL
ncbi:MAG: DUF2237 domain-containing protein [Saprospiraceae bacterium]